MAYWTGMRSREILKLTWDKVDLANRIIKLEASDTKEKMPKRIPVSKPLRSILMQIPERGRQGLVFKYAGKRVKDIRDGLKNACQKSDIIYGRFKKNGFIFHDFRHTFTTNARRAGVHKNVVMAIQGHSAGGDMNRRYDTIEDSDLLGAIDKIETYLKNVDHLSDQRLNSEGNNNTNN
jgi:integrase